MNEDIDEDSRHDIEWSDRDRRMDQILKDTFPELDKLALIKWVEDWLFCQNEVDEYDYQLGCYRRALEMFDYDSPIRPKDLPRSDFSLFIRPALDAFFEHNPLSDAAKLAIITEILEL